MKIHTESLHHLWVDGEGTIKSGGELFSPQEYSRFKYGSKKQARVYGHQLATHMAGSALCGEFNHGNTVVVSSAHRHVPTASANLMGYFVDGLNILFANQNMPSVATTKITREQQVAGDYGKLSLAERRKRMDRGAIHIDQQFIRGKNIIVVDDVRITGAHEERIQRLFSEFHFLSTLFLYIATFEEGQETIDPIVEDRLNHTAIHDLADFAELLENEECLINARICKFVLSTNPVELDSFLSRLSGEQDEFLYTLYSSIIGDEYHAMPVYQRQFAMVENEVRRRGLLSLLQQAK